ncbi:MAG: S24/S26 family peptidase [Bacteroidales bacterium]|nr:S24/S26 family peptidase [Bacteroidales bacterium]
MKQVLVPNEQMLGEVSALLSEGRSVVFLAKGASMRPFIEGDADSVLLERRTPVQVGDIALAHLSGGNWVLHRVVSVCGNDVTLRGDGNLRGEEHCTAADIAGTVREIQKKSGRKIRCYSRCFRFRSRLWRLLPRLLRRVFLGIQRRLI